MTANEDDDGTGSEGVKVTMKERGQETKGQVAQFT